MDIKTKQSVLTKYHIDPDTKKPITVPVVEKQQVHPLKNLIQMVGEVKKNKKIQIIDRDMIPVNKPEKITQPYHYYVDYEQNLIHFHPDIAGQTVEYKYEDMGVTVISANKVFTKQDEKGNVVELLEDIIRLGREAIDVMETIGGVAIVMKRLEDDIKEGYEVSDKIQADIQQAKDEILNVRGNKEVIIQSSQWSLNGDVYEKEITHDLNSENLHVTAKNSDTKEAVTIGYKIVDKTRILLKSDEAINMSVILSASYYHATQTISDDIAEEVVKARKGEVDLKTKIDSIDEQLDTIEMKKANNGFFTILNEIKNNENIPNYTVDDYYSLYQGLVDNNSSRFTWLNLGKDQSDTYDIRLYRYIPTDYNRTLFITCAIHGWEHYGTYIMYLLFKKLLDDTTLTPNLFELRKTRILCIPIANPWGLMADNHSGYNATRRGNSRGVDLNRNFDYRWEQNSGGFGLSKGEYAFSEKETQYIKQVMEEYKITHFLDLHSFNNSKSETRDYLFYGNPESKNNTYQITNWLEKVYVGCNISHTMTENDSSSNNYANRVKNIPSMNIELIKNRYGADDDRRWLELIENYLMLQAVSYHSYSYGTKNGSKINQREAKNTFDYSVPTEWTTVTELGNSYDIDCDGILLVNGFLTVSFENGDNTTVFTYSPYVSQEKFYTTKSTGTRNKPYIKLSSGSITVPVNCMMYVKKGYGTATFGIDVIKEGTGTITIRRCDCTYLFIPCDNTYFNMLQHNKV